METSFEPGPFHMMLPVRHLPMRVKLVEWLDDDALFAFCALNRDLRIERTAEGELLIMRPTGGETGRRNAGLLMQLGVWAERDGAGFVFDSSTGFVLPNGAERSPDAAWVGKARWNALTTEQREKFPPLAPDFVIELLSPSDVLPDAHAKMREYIENGVRLGFLLDLDIRVAFVYREGGAVERIDDAKRVAGEPILPGFVLDLERIA